MSVLLILKLVCLFFTIFFTFVNVGRIIAKNEVPAINMFSRALATFGFIVLQFELFK